MERLAADDLQGAGKVEPGAIGDLQAAERFAPDLLKTVQQLEGAVQRYVFKHRGGDCGTADFQIAADLCAFEETGADGGTLT